MLTCHCPRCGEVLGLPAAAVPADATAQCPWCGELYPASEIIDKLPPMVALISADGQPLFLEAAQGVANAALATAATGASATMTDSWDDNTELTIESDGHPGFDGDEFADAEQAESERANAGQGGAEMMDFLSDHDAETGSAETGAASDFGDHDDESNGWGTSGLDAASAGEESRDAAPLMPMKVRSVPASNLRRKKSSPIKTLIGVAMGPLVALPLAGGILLWLGKAPDLGFWPFDGSFNKGSSSRVSAAPGYAQNDPIDPMSDASETQTLGTFGSPMVVPELESSDELDRANAALANLGAETNAATSDGPSEGPSEGIGLPSLGTSLKPSSEASNVDLDMNEEVAYPTDPVADAVETPMDTTPAKSGSEQDPVNEIAADLVPMPAPETMPIAEVPALETPVPETPVAKTPTAELDPASAEPVEIAKSMEVSESSEAANSDAALSLDANSTPEATKAEAEEAMAVAEPVATEPVTTEPAASVETAKSAEPVKADEPGEATIAESSEKAVKSAETRSAVDSAVAKAEGALASLVAFEGEESERRRLLAKSYAIISAVVTETGAGDSPAVQQFVSELSQSPQVKDLGDATALWLDYAKRPTDGVLIVGKPGSNAAGNVVHISTSSSAGRDVVVTGASLPDAEKVIGLGRIVPSDDGPSVELIVVERMNP